MCGICGYFHFQNKKNTDISEAVIKRMTDKIYHRGPDDDGYFTNNRIALGMRRLAIIDINTGSQPQFNEDKNVVVILNGEIYNYQELKSELVKEGHLFKTKSDTEVLVHLYEEKGKDFVKYLNGMFAIALFDRRKNLLFLVRDRMGIKPLHYSITDNTIVFASEIKSILEYPEIRKKISPISLYNYFTFEFISAPRTVYKGVHKILPGEMLIITQNGEIKKNKYWKIKINKQNYSLEELNNKLKNIFLTSVKYRLISDVPLGIFLSGGIDSTLLVGAASKYTDKVKTFSIGFSEESFNELKYAKIASNYFNTDHTEMVLSYKKAIDLLPSIMDYLDEPHADASIIPTFLVSKLSKKIITVALSGDGGDELFLGYDTYKAYKFAKYVRWIPHPFIKTMENITSLIPASSKRVSWEFKLKKFLNGLLYKPEISNYIWWGAYPPELKKQLFTRDFLNLITNNIEFEPIEFYEKDLLKIDSPLDRVNYLDLHLYLQDNLLPKVDRMSMINSLEVRVPFLDHRMVELAVSIHNKYRLKGLKTKYILKKSLKELIPPQLMKRPKIGFDIPLGVWLRNELKDYMMSLLDIKKIKNTGIFDPDFVEKIIKIHLSGKQNFRQLLWPIMIFQNWYDKNNPELTF